MFALVCSEFFAGSRASAGLVPAGFVAYFHGPQRSKRLPAAAAAAAAAAEHREKKTKKKKSEVERDGGVTAPSREQTAEGHVTGA